MEDRFETTFLRDYAADCCTKTMKTDFDALAEMARILLQSKHEGKKIWTCGNGGSAATASHICNDLQKGARVYERTGFSATCLGDSLPVVTCLGNDFGYDDIFRIPVETQAEEGDVLLAFSGSGNSENVIRAAQAARVRGVKVLGFLGRDGGRLKPLCDCFVLAPTDCMEQIEDMHMLYCHALVSLLKKMLQSEWGAEIVRPARGRTFRTALFDFDGTVSLIRADWREAMIPYFTDTLQKVSAGIPREAVEATVNGFVDALTGKQTIFQCIALDEEVQRRGGAHVDSNVYKEGFLARMAERVHARIRGLKNGTIAPEQLMVPGVLDWVRCLESKGVRCYLASGTDEANVREEAELLGVDPLFSGGIVGARPEQSEGVKEALLRTLINSGEVSGETLVCFGDGPSELEATKAVGGYAVGVAFDESVPYGIDLRKRSLLLPAGADLVIPDYTDAAALLRLLRVFE